jgi:uncharacterized protein (DUF924 family)
MSIAGAEDVLEFWFKLDPRAWFRRDDAFDADLRARFGDTHAAATRGELDDWTRTPRGTLALVIVLDQMSRNLYRDDPRAFANDPRALALARELVRTRGIDTLAPIERMFVLLPFEHSEDLAAQRDGVAEFETVAAAAPGDQMLAMGLDYAKRHAAVIERFGRFPHRNAVLGRASTPEEAAFLEQPGSRF